MTAVFYVEREMMHHVMQTYLPTALIVVISWFVSVFVILKRIVTIESRAEPKLTV